jgi:prevent-host-death family protein
MFLTYRTLKGNQEVSMSKIWQLQYAKNQFSELVQRAIQEGPQLVTKFGKPAVYVISARMFKRLKPKRGTSLKELLLHSPHKEIQLNLTRSNEKIREVAL